MLSPSPSPSSFSCPISLSPSLSAVSSAASTTSASTSPTNSTAGSVASLTPVPPSPPPLTFINHLHLQPPPTLQAKEEPLQSTPTALHPSPSPEQLPDEASPAHLAVALPSLSGAASALIPAMASPSSPSSPSSSSSSSSSLSDGEEGASSAPSKLHRRGRWSPAEDALLKQWVEHYDGKNWKRIAESAFGASKSDVQCLTGDHRVLTRSGWRGIPYISAGDVVASYHIPTASLQWKRVTAVQCFDVVEDADPDDEDTFRLFRMQGSGMDVLATRDHRMLVARLRTGGLAREPYRFETVGQLAEMAYISSPLASHTKFAYSGVRAVLRSNLNVQPAVKLVMAGMEEVCDWWWRRDQQRSFLRFLGFWLGDGHLGMGRNRVGVSQRKPAGVAWVEDLLDEVFPRWWYRNVITEDEDGITYGYVIRCPPLYDWFRLLAAGPLGYNPLDPSSLRNYPHGQPGAGLAAEERQHRYRKSSGPSTWTEAAMLAAMRLGPEQCWWCAERGSEEGRELMYCDGDGCGQCGHVGPDCSGLTAPPEGRWLCPDCSDPIAAHGDEDVDDDVGLLTAEEEVAEEVDVSLGLDEAGEEDDAMVDDQEVEDDVDLKDPLRKLRAYVLGTTAAAETARAKGQVVWHCRQVQEQLSAPTAAVLLDEEGEEGIEEEEEAPVTAVAPIIWNGGLWYILNGNWFYLKRWMGANVAGTFTKLSRAQAVALLEGFCRADGTWESVQFGEQGGAGGLLAVQLVVLPAHRPPAADRSAGRRLS